MPAVKRSYQSTVRRQRAEATRRRIVDAARRLFARHRLAGTSIEAIARQARVSAPTVYLVFASKLAIAIAVLHAVEETAGLPRLIEATASDRAPREQIRALARFNRTLFTHAGDLIEAARAARHDPGLAAIEHEGSKRRRGGMTRLVQGWRRRRALRAGMSVTRATDLMWLLTAPDVYRLLVQECGWSPATYERWLVQTITDWVLA
jgi:AcrR family transcriptional regulator